MEIVGLVIGIVGLLLAISEIKKRKGADARAEQLARENRTMHTRTSNELQTVLQALGAPTPFGINGADPAEGRSFDAQLVDIDGDGREELLVAATYGPHSSMLRAFGFRDDYGNDFGQVAELPSGTPLGFTVGDLAGDGAIEVAAFQPREGYPFVLSVYDEVLYRWDGQAFAEIARHRLPGQLDDPSKQARWHTGQHSLTLV